MPLEFVSITSSNSQHLAALVEIYQEAIDPSEQKTPGEVRTMLSDPRYVLVACRSNDDIVGFFISFFPDEADFWLLEYMAVGKAVRSGGVGAALFQEAYASGLRRDPARVMLLEVDVPGGATDPKNDTTGRLRFYRRMGCRRISGLSYILPLDADGVPPPMMLLTYAVPAMTEVGKIRVRQWLEAIYADVYGRSRHDSRIEIMLSQLGDGLPLQEI